MTKRITRDLLSKWKSSLTGTLRLLMPGGEDLRRTLSDLKQSTYTGGVPQKGAKFRCQVIFSQLFIFHVSNPCLFSKPDTDFDFREPAPVLIMLFISCLAKLMRATYSRQPCWKRFLVQSSGLLFNIQMFGVWTSRNVQKVALSFTFQLVA